MLQCLRSQSIREIVFYESIWDLLVGSIWPDYSVRYWFWPQSRDKYRSVYIMEFNNSRQKQEAEVRWWVDCQWGQNGFLEKTQRLSIIKFWHWWHKVWWNCEVCRRLNNRRIILQNNGLKTRFSWSCCVQAGVPCLLSEKKPAMPPAIHVLLEKEQKRGGGGGRERTNTKKHTAKPKTKEESSD